QLPHVGVEREIQGTQQDLAVGGDRHRRLLQAEIGGGRCALRAGIEDDAAVRGGRVRHLLLLSILDQSSIVRDKKNGATGPGLILAAYPPLPYRAARGHG